MCHSKYMETGKQCSGLNPFISVGFLGSKSGCPLMMMFIDFEVYYGVISWRHIIFCFLIILFWRIYIWRVLYGTLQELGRKCWNLLKAEKKNRRNLDVQVWHVDFDFISFAVSLNWSSFLPSNFCKVPIMTWARPWHGSFPVFASSCHLFYVAMKSF